MHKAEQLYTTQSQILEYQYTTVDWKLKLSLQCTNSNRHYICYKKNPKPMRVIYTSLVSISYFHYQIETPYIYFHNL